MRLVSDSDGLDKRLLFEPTTTLQETEVYLGTTYKVNVCYKNMNNCKDYSRFSTSLMILLYSSAESNFSMSEKTEFKMDILDMIDASCPYAKDLFQTNINDQLWV